MKPFAEASGTKFVEATVSKLRPMVETGTPEWDVLTYSHTNLWSCQMKTNFSSSIIMRWVAPSLRTIRGAPSSLAVGTILYAKVIAFNAIEVMGQTVGQACGSSRNPCVRSIDAAIIGSRQWSMWVRCFLSKIELKRWIYAKVQRLWS